MIDRLPPHAEDAERALLGSVLIDQAALSDVMETLRPEHFYRQGNGLIYAAMIEVYNRSEGPDVVTVAAQLNSHLEEVGGLGYLSSLASASPTSINAVEYADIIKRKATMRGLIKAAGDIASVGYESPGDTQEALDRALLSLRDVISKADVGRTHFEKAGFRAYSLAAPNESWKLILSRVDVNDREPKGLMTLYTKANPEAQADLDGYTFCRTVGLFGGTNLKSLAKELAERVGDKPETWAKRLDYLAQRTIREAQASAETASMQETPEKLVHSPWLFRGRMRVGRTISLFGPGSAGKTTISDGLALSACTGYEIIPHWLPTRTFTVGLLDWDEGEEETKVRMRAMCNAYGVTVSDFFFRRMARPLADCADDVGKWLVDNAIELVIVSPVSRAIRQGQGDPAAPIHELYEVLREFHTTNLLIAHVVGSAIDSDRQANREYGSVAQTNDARGSYSVYAQSEEPGRRVVVLKNTKPDALSPRMDPQAIRIEFEPPEPDEAGNYNTIRFELDEIGASPQQSHGRETQVEKFIRILREDGPMGSSEMAIRHGCKADYVRFLVSKAKKLGFNVTLKDGRYWLVTGSDD
jgi:hypothetical protein